MVPPIDPSSDSVKRDAPYTHWRNMGSFDTAADCAAEQSKLQQSAAVLTQDSQPIQLRILGRSQVAARCVASDDPRLKEK